MAEAEHGCASVAVRRSTCKCGRAIRRVIAFYQSIGFVLDDVVSLGKRLEQD